MKLKVTAEPFRSTRDGKWYVIVQHGAVVEHIPVAADGTDAAEVIAGLFGIRKAVAARAIATPGTYVPTPLPGHAALAKPPDPGKTPVMKALEKATRPKAKRTRKVTK